MTRLFTKTMLPALLLGLLTLSACSDDDENDSLEKYYINNPGTHTIIAYIVGDNNLSSNLKTDISEMVAGSVYLDADCRYIVFADFPSSNPCIMQLKDGERDTVYQFESDFYATSPDNMREVFQWVANHYPSTKYSALFAGHGSGSLVSNDTVEATTPVISLNAFGYDQTGDGTTTSANKWINVDDMATALGQLKTVSGQPLHFDNIFFDVCCMQNIETAYELRDITDYIIAPASEVPSSGANYTRMLQALSTATDSLPEIALRTYEEDAQVCASVVKTQYLDELCTATAEALQTLDTTQILQLSTSRCIYYYKVAAYIGPSVTRVAVLHDMKNVMRRNLSEEAYDNWLAAFNKVVVSSTYATSWQTSINVNTADFYESLNDADFGGISMIVPNVTYQYCVPQICTEMFHLQWINNVGWASLGWDAYIE